MRSAYSPFTFLCCCLVVNVTPVRGVWISIIIIIMTWTPGDFIKPEPTLSVEATRDHILNELYRYFKTSAISTKTDRFLRIKTHTSIDEETLGDIIFDILHAYLADSRSFLRDLLPDNIEPAFFDEVIGYIAEDTLPDSSTTILSLWPPEADSDSDSEEAPLVDVSFWDVTIPVPIHVVFSGLALVAAWLLANTLYCTPYA